MQPADIHLVCGSTGAGKTTYAARLADEIGALRFSIDEWMTALFWMDSPQPLDPAWSIERVDRAAAMIWRVAADAARRGMPAILEIGLTTRAARARISERAAADRLGIRLHFIDVPADERWRRVSVRNDAPADEAQLSFAVTREMFDFVEGIWEPPSAHELATMNGVRIAA